MATTWRVSGSEVGHLVTRIFDATRTEPMVVVSPTSQTCRPRIDVPRLVELLPPGTEVAVLESMEASNLLSDAVDPQFQCYGGSVRVILPGAARTDNWRRHRLFTIYPEDDPEAVCALIARHVAESQGTGPSQHVSGRPSTGLLDPQQAAKLLAYRRRLLEHAGQNEPARPAAPQHNIGPKPGPGPHRVVQGGPAQPEQGRTPDPVPEPHPAAGSADAAGAAPLDVEILERLLDRKVDLIVKRVTSGVEDGLLALLNEEFQAQDRERSRADTLEEQNADLQRRLDAATTQGAASVRVYTDPGKQLRWEIEQEWLLGTPEAERASGLKRYTLGPRFLESMEADIVPRGKTVRVMVDILAGRGWDRHETHPFNDAPRGGRQRVRADGAQAWRTYVKAESHGAPRLTWWLCTDGAVEFDHVGHHDELI